MNIKKKFFSLKKGTATGIAMGFSAGIMLVSAGAATFVMNTSEENEDLEGSVVSYYAAERGIEYAQYDVSGHLAGYEVAPIIDGDENYGKLESNVHESKTRINVSSRSDSESLEVTLPLPGNGSSDDEDWNSLTRGKSVTIPLYIDNTSIQ